MRSTQGKVFGAPVVRVLVCVPPTWLKGKGRPLLLLGVPRVSGHTEYLKRALPPSAGTL